MKILRVFSNKASFKQIIFSPNFNVIIANKSELSSDKDSRNGSGKSTLIEIINYCLGSNLQSCKTINKPELNDWVFSIEIELDDYTYIISRDVLDESTVRIKGESFDRWPIKPDEISASEFIMSTKDWTEVLGSLVFKIKKDLPASKMAPSFRSLISYFIRKGDSAFNDPFTYFAQQKPLNVQILTAYLLGLNWEYVSDLEVLKKKIDSLSQLKKAAENGVLAGYLGSLGELEAEKVRLNDYIKQSEIELKDFNVLPQYENILTKVQEIKNEIEKFRNTLIINTQLIEKYNYSLKSETEIPLEEVEQIYKEIGIIFSPKLTKELNEVKAFHDQIIKNRHDYLSQELKDIKHSNNHINFRIEDLEKQKSDYLKILNTHNAINEQFEMQNLLIEYKQKLSEVNSRIANLKKVEDDASNLKIEKEQLIIKMRQDFKERIEIREAAISVFNANTQFLYNTPGSLIVEIDKSGYKFDITLERTGSEGVGHMEILMYDLTIAEIQKRYFNRVVPIIHDTTIFAEVDGRQTAKALELAYQTSIDFDLQYICALNSDMMPYDEFSDDFKEKYKSITVINLSDDPTGGLLGIRF